MKTSLLLSSLLLATTALTFTGCSTVKLDESGDTSAVYQLGEFKMVLNTTAPAAFQATQKAFKELDLYQIKADQYAYEANLSARTRDDKKVYVKIAEINSRQTDVKIRWGTTGSQEDSRALYERIERNLH